jgi:hypothetical protein
MMVDRMYKLGEHVNVEGEKDAELAKVKKIYVIQKRSLTLWIDEWGDPLREFAATPGFWMLLRCRPETHSMPIP